MINWKDKHVSLCVLHKDAVVTIRQMGSFNLLLQSLELGSHAALQWHCPVQLPCKSPGADMQKLRGKRNKCQDKGWMNIPRYLGSLAYPSSTSCHSSDGWMRLDFRTLGNRHLSIFLCSFPLFPSFTAARMIGQVPVSLHLPRLCTSLLYGGQVHHLHCHRLRV